MRKIAEIIGRDPDELLALAGQVESDLTEIIRQRPRVSRPLPAQRTVAKSEAAFSTISTGVSHSSGYP